VSRKNDAYLLEDEKQSWGGAGGLGVGFIGSHRRMLGKILR